MAQAFQERNDSVRNVHFSRRPDRSIASRYSGRIRTSLGQLLEFLPLVQSLVGEVVSHVWFSDYSICYLEFGAMETGRKLPHGRIGNRSGEITVFLGYDWESDFNGVQRSRLDFHADRTERDLLATKLQGAAVRTVEFIAESAEFEICLSTGVVLRTVSDEGEDPDWSIKISKPITGYICIKNQKLKFECENP